MQERILEILQIENRAYGVQELYDVLGLKTIDDFKELVKTLNELEDVLKIYRTKKDNYMLFNNSHLKIGKMIVNKKGFGFVDVDGDKDIFVAQSNMNQAIHGDTVIVEIISKSHVNPEGKIVKIAKRDFKQMVGEFYILKDKGYIDLDDDKVKITIEIDKNKTMSAMPGHKVLVKIGSKLEGNKYKGEVIKIIGHKNDPGVDILSIAYKYGINDSFSDEVMEEVDTLPNTVSEEEMVDRKDLRNHKIFTIDGSDTKDIDDAIEIKKLDNGNYELGVHIADVSYYVKHNSAIDKEAYDRGTSVYLADRVIPMLPHKLSNGICSLNPGVDRLAMSCVMEIDKKGEVVSYDIFQSVINSKKQMTYDAVNNYLENDIVNDGYEEYTTELKLMSELADVLREMKEKRGYIDFDIDESKIIVDEKGKAIDVQLRERGIGQKLIEDFMIAANETIATHIYFMELPFVYRIHGEPNEEKITNFLKFVSILGYKVDGKVKSIHPKTMQDILAQLNEKKEFHILSRLLLRSMQKAVYDKNNIGHFGLASKCYTHFTSPIRRYPDLTVHRLLRTYLFNNNMDKDTFEYWDRELPFLTEHASTKERNSIECEREVDDMKKAEYMESHIGEEYEGIINSVLSFGMFVELPNLIEGLVRLDDLGDGKDRYTYDETTFTIRGNKNKRGYRLGDTVLVLVKDANKEAKTIDFVINDEYAKKKVKVKNGNIKS